MAMKINELSPQQVGESIQAFCTLCDISPPENPQQLIFFIKRQYGTHEAEVLARALNYWASIESRIMKPKRINGYFVAQCMTQYIDSRRSNMSQDLLGRSRARVEEKRQLTNYERREIHKECMEAMLDSYEKAFYKKQPGMMIWKGWEVSHKIALEFGDYKTDDFDSEWILAKVKELQDWHGYDQKQQDRSKLHKNPFAKLTSAVEIDWENVAYVALHFDNIIAMQNV